jgi:hypothetical protein
MHLTSILHLLIALAYLMAGRTAMREGQLHAARHDRWLALLYAGLALIDLPLVDLGSVLHGLAQYATQAVA